MSARRIIRINSQCLCTYLILLICWAQAESVAGMNYDVNDR